MLKYIFFKYTFLRY